MHCILSMTELLSWTKTSAMENLWLDAAGHSVHWGAPEAAVLNQRMKQAWQWGSPASWAPKVYGPISLCSLHTAAQWRLCSSRVAKSTVWPSLSSSDLTSLTQEVNVPVMLYLKILQHLPSSKIARQLLSNTGMLFCHKLSCIFSTTNSCLDP